MDGDDLLAWRAAADLEPTAVLDQIRVYFLASTHYGKNTGIINFSNGPQDVVNGLTSLQPRLSQGMNLDHDC